MSKAEPVSTTPQWETRSRKPLPGGRIQGIAGGMWLYRAVPFSNIVEAKTVKDAVGGGAGLHRALEELAKLAPSRGLNRRMVKAKYRQVHMLLVNIPTWFTAIPGSPTEGFLNRSFSNTPIIKRMLLFGVKLDATPGSGGWKSMVDSFTETLVHGGPPLSDFDKDFEDVDGALSRAGFTVPSNEEFALANSWWNHGAFAATPVLAHEEHLHFFRRTGAVREAERAGLTDCEVWPEVEGQSAITFASVRDFHLPYSRVEDAFARWVPPLLDDGVRAISIRALVEPAGITRQELRSQSRRYRADMAESTSKGKMTRAEHEEREDELRQLEDSYARDEATATLVDTSVLVAIDGVVDDPTRIGTSAVSLDPMVNRQAQAWHETMICSNIAANPHLHDLPTTAIAYSGLPALTQVGDSDGALLGFTERDRQPVYISPTAASAGDAAPTMLCAAATGAGKTILLQWMAHQFAELGRPGVIIDPKSGSDLAPAVELSGGQVASLDDFVRSDGALDPLRFSPNREVGVQMAASMISTVNPWGSIYLRQQHETDVADAIRHGVSRGAEATGQALQIAVQDGIVPREVVEPIFKMANSYPMFRATFGMQPGTQPLTVASGITLFKVGQAQFKRPTLSDRANMAEAEPLVRTSVNAIRMMVAGSMMALTGRGGVLHIDESWMVESSTPDALEEIGRLARSQNVLPILYTQTPSGPINLGLKGYMSRGLIGHIKDEDEASAGLALFSASSEKLLARVTAEEFDGAALNWNSLKALRNQETRVFERGSVFYHADLRGRLAPVEIVIPPEFMKLASTTPEEVARRQEGRRRAGGFAPAL